MAVAAKGTLVADVVAADTVAGVAPCTMGTFRKENHISKHTEECSSMGNHGNRWLSHRVWCLYQQVSHVTRHHHQQVTCNHSAKQDNIPESRGRRKRKGKNACYHPIKGIDIITFNYFHLYSLNKLKKQPLLLPYYNNYTPPPIPTMDNIITSRHKILHLIFMKHINECFSLKYKTVSTTLELRVQSKSTTADKREQNV